MSQIANCDGSPSRGLNGGAALNDPDYILWRVRAYLAGANLNSRPAEWARWKPFQIVLGGSPGLKAA